MGAIYLVRHRLLDELRVVKVLRSQLNTDEDLRGQRFLREAKTAIQLRHPNSAQLYDFSVDEDGAAYMVMEFIDGVSSWITEGGAYVLLPNEEALKQMLTQAMSPRHAPPKNRRL